MSKFYGIIEAFIALFVGMVLLPMINSTANAMNVTGSTQVIVLAIPALFALSLMVVAVKTMISD